jgi:TRAP-type C4-dicarboxylate transport system permease small subunit
MEIEQALDVKTNTWLDKALIAIMVFCFAMTIVAISAQLVFRWLPYQVSLSQYTQAVGKYSLIVGTNFGAAVAARNNEHISMYFLLERLEARAPRLHSLFNFVATAVVTVFLIVATAAGGTSAIRNWGGNFGSADFVTMGQMLALIAAGLFFYLLYSLEALWESVQLVRKRWIGQRVPRAETADSTVDDPSN